MNFKVGAGINIKCEDEYCRYLSLAGNERQLWQMKLDKNVVYITLKTVGLFSHNVYYVKGTVPDDKFMGL